MISITNSIAKNVVCVVTVSVVLGLGDGALARGLMQDQGRPVHDGRGTPTRQRLSRRARPKTRSCCADHVQLLGVFRDERFRQHHNQSTMADLMEIDEHASLSRNTSSASLWRSRSRADALDACLRSRGAEPCPWQPITKSPKKASVFSAYYDSRSGRPLVRMVSVMQKQDADDLVCLFPPAGADDLLASGVGHGVDASPGVGAENREQGVRGARQAWIATPGTAKQFYEFHAETNPYTHGCAFVDCPLPGSHSPGFVSVRSAGPVPPDLHDTASILREGNLVPIVYPGGAPAPRYELGACVKVIPPGFRYMQHMLEYFEYYRMMGVEHFTVYSNSTDPGVNCILDVYVKLGIVDVIDFKLDMDPDDSHLDLHVSGSDGSLVDCAYRRQHQYKYMLHNLDFDEFLVPRNGEASILDLINATARHHNVSSLADVASVIYQNTFFWIPEDQPDAPASGPPSWKQPRPSIYERSVYEFPEWRSKSILVPLNVYHPGVHWPEEVVAGKANVRVDPTLAFVQHYRLKTSGMRVWYPDNTTITDEAFKRYEPKFMRRLLRMRDVVWEKCGGRKDM